VTALTFQLQWVLSIVLAQLIVPTDQLQHLKPQRDSLAGTAINKSHTL